MFPFHGLPSNTTINPTSDSYDVCSSPFFASTARSPAQFSLLSFRSLVSLHPEAVCTLSRLWRWGREKHRAGAPLVLQRIRSAMSAQTSVLHLSTSCSRVFPCGFPRREVGSKAHTFEETRSFMIIRKPEKISGSCADPFPKPDRPCRRNPGHRRRQSSRSRTKGWR